VGSAKVHIGAPRTWIKNPEATQINIPHNKRSCTMITIQPIPLEGRSKVNIFIKSSNVKQIYYTNKNKFVTGCDM